MNKIGFTAGTFDMFHVGHLNLIKKAKENCDYLIVGVNSKKLVESYKKKSPLIPEEDRLEIVRAIKYVDEVHMMDSLDKVKAYKLYGFSTVFIGDDYKDSPRYKKTEQNLKEYNVNIEYLPYTEKVSSTILSKKIIHNELNKKFYNLDKV
ncbi:adenylyltransferase/cytidyltransferase family protein [Enterococcus devriesei]|uniref:adenylyltransferase/cytidyltransferase family protein n=1 Tax=Enterococcus devriesei TaxID=319970 RepID=UPI0028AD31DB|nr:adenylyltransferase/cytidyltransferase family protein [Enterococcus devriesei]